MLISTDNADNVYEIIISDIIYQESGYWFLASSTPVHRKELKLYICSHKMGSNLQPVVGSAVCLIKEP